MDDQTPPRPIVNPHPSDIQLPAEDLVMMAIERIEDRQLTLHEIKNQHALIKLKAALRLLKTLPIFRIPKRESDELA